MQHRSLHHSLLAPALLVGWLSVAPHASAQVAAPGPPASPQSVDMTIEGRGANEPTLEEILLEYGERTGTHLSWSADTAQVLKSIRPGLDRRLTIPPEELREVIEAVLITHRIIGVETRREEPRMMLVSNLDSPARSTIRAEAIFVSAEELPRYADRPGTLITTVVELDSLDVRTLGNAMRAAVVDPNTMQLVPIPESNQLILTGLGSQIVRMAGLLRELNENAASPDRGAAAPPRARPRFPTPSTGMTLAGRGENELTLADVLSEFGRVSGEHLIWTAETAQVLSYVDPGLDRELVIAPEQVYSLIETILITNRFALVDLRREEPRMMAVVSLDSPARSSLRSTNARHISVKDLPFYANHPALPITTVVQLPRLDVRVLGNAMRAMIVDPNTMMLIPIPESNQLVVGGFGANIVTLLETLQHLNDNAPMPEGD